jgi:hypothetical protein
MVIVAPLILGGSHSHIYEKQRIPPWTAVGAHATGHYVQNDPTNLSGTTGTHSGHTHTFTTNNTGSGTNYIQPYYVLAYIQRIL